MDNDFRSTLFRENNVSQLQIDRVTDILELLRKKWPSYRDDELLVYWLCRLLDKTDRVCQIAKEINQESL